MLNFILFCSGKGGDPNSYRPNRDDSQWWGRRDAQARCVAAALYGPSPPRRRQQEKREKEGRQVVFLYDEDLALLRMTSQTTTTTTTTTRGASSVCSGVSDHDGMSMSVGGDNNKQDGNFFPMPQLPTESNLIRVWKKAALNPIKVARMTRGRSASSISSRIDMTKEEEDDKEDDKGDVRNKQRDREEERFYCFMELESWNDSSIYSPCNLIDDNNNNNSSRISQVRSVSSNSNRSRSRKEAESMSKRALLQEIQSLLNQWKGTRTNTSTSAASSSSSSSSSHKEEQEETLVLEFLRKWRLNSSQDVVLRKVNQKTMQMAYWDLVSIMGIGDGKGDGVGNGHGKRHNMSKSKNDHDATVTNIKTLEIEHDDYGERLHKTLCHVLTSSGSHFMSNHQEAEKEIKSTTNEKSMDAIAIYLHETCHLELPVFGNKEIWTYYAKKRLLKDDDGDEKLAPAVVSDHVPRHIHVCLGAVRDITMAEYIVLQRACQTMNIPLVGCHLGPVAEFTSKIITAVAFHSHVGILNKAVKDLYNKAVEQKSLGIDQMLRQQGNGHEKNSGDNKRQKYNNNRRTNLQYRNQHMWNLVRVCVASLWRSKVASSSSLSSSASTCSTTASTTQNDTASHSSSLTNKLTLFFQCGHTIHLDQNDLVLSLAERHQAAPSEHQILKALCEKITACSSNSKYEGFSLDIDCPVDKAIAMDFTTSAWYASNQQTSDNSGTTTTGSVNGHGKDLSFLAKIYQESCACNVNETKKIVRKDDTAEPHYLISLMNLSCQNVEQKQQYDGILSHIQRLGIPIIYHHGPLMIDTIAQLGTKKLIDVSVTITMLQHFAYHGRLFSAFMESGAVVHSSKKED